MTMPPIPAPRPYIMAVPDDLRDESPMERTPLLLSIPETARMMGVSETKTKEYVMTGEWPSIKIGTRRLVVYLKLLQWIEERQA